MARRGIGISLDSFPEGFAPGGAEELAQLLGYPQWSQELGDMAHYGADFPSLLTALHQRIGMDQAQQDAAIKLLLGQQDNQTRQSVANTAANASMYGADQGLAGHKLQAEASANIAGSRNQNVLERAAMETKQREQASIQAAQARIQAAMLGRQGQLDAANIRNQGALNVAAVKALPPEVGSQLWPEVVKRAGGDQATAIGIWKQVLGARGYDPNTPIPGVK